MAETPSSSRQSLALEATASLASASSNPSVSRHFLSDHPPTPSTVLHDYLPRASLFQTSSGFCVLPYLTFSSMSTAFKSWLKIHLGKAFSDQLQPCLHPRQPPFLDQWALKRRLGEVLVEEASGEIMDQEMGQRPLCHDLCSPVSVGGLNVLPPPHPRPRRSSRAFTSLASSPEAVLPGLTAAPVLGQPW